MQVANGHLATEAVAAQRGARPLLGRTALVTGASQGIGRALALRLAEAGCAVRLVGRSEPALQEVADLGGDGCLPIVTDLLVEEQVRELADEVLAEGEVDLLVHCGGEYVRGPVADVPVEALDRQYRLSVRVPYLLTQLLLPLLCSRSSDVVFIGSTVRPAPGVGALAIGQAAQQALVHTLRGELADCDLRVLSVFPGRTATPRQARIFALEGRPEAYQPARLLQPEDVAEAVLAALAMDRRAEVTEVWMRPAVATY